jgi:hypothetical protein
LCQGRKKLSNHDNKKGGERYHVPSKSNKSDGIQYGLIILTHETIKCPKSTLKIVCTHAECKKHNKSAMLVDVKVYSELGGGRWKHRSSKLCHPKEPQPMLPVLKMEKEGHLSHS